MKSYKNEIKTDFQDEGKPSEQTPCLIYLLILYDPVYKRDKSYYPQALSEECKYTVKDKKNGKINN